MMFVLFQLARNKFRSLLADSSEHLKQLGKKLGKCVNKARPYYDVLRESKKVTETSSLLPRLPKLPDSFE